MSEIVSKSGKHNYCCELRICTRAQKTSLLQHLLACISTSLTNELNSCKNVVKISRSTPVFPGSTIG